MPALCTPLTKPEWIALLGDWFVPEPNTGCWLWMRSLTTRGYGQFARNRQRFCAHRVSYELVRGAIPEGLQIDHLCRTRSCVNPDHLEPVTAQVNQRRGRTISAYYATRTHCVNGHEFTPENTAFYKGKS